MKEVSSGEGEEEGEGGLSAEEWTPIQHSLFTEVNYCLQELYLQRLSTREHPLEPIIRRLDTEKYSEKVRSSLASTKLVVMNGKRNFRPRNFCLIRD